MSPIVRFASSGPACARNRRPWTLDLGLWTNLCLALLLAGCSKSPTPNPDSTLNPQPSTPVLRFHWLGKQRLATEANATNFMAIWNLPESARLEAQTLDKLATASWRLWQTNVAVSNAPTALLRPLLDDVVQAESYLEVSGATNQPGELVFAIRLSADRAALWATNLPPVLQSLARTNSEARPSSAGLGADFTLHTSHFALNLSRSGDWTLLSARLSTNSSQPSTLLESFRSRIATTQTPFAARATNYWIELETDTFVFLPHFFAAASRPLALLQSNSPHLSLRVGGEAGNVRTLGELIFPKPVRAELEPWNIPTNLVHDPLIGFLAVRGFRPWLSALGWDEVRWDKSPNQAFFWAQDGAAPLHFFAVPSATASNQTIRFGDYLLTNVNPLMATSASVQNTPLGSFERVPDSQRLRWKGLPLLTPNLDWVDNDGNPFITGGLFINRLTNRPVPVGLLQQFHQESDLLLYDWEITQPCERRLIQASQFGRFVFGRSRFAMTNNMALPWLVAIAPKLGVSGTALRLSSSDRMFFSRSSSLGLTAAEIHLFADWLESPDFPCGLFTINSQPKPPVIGGDQKF